MSKSFDCVVLGAGFVGLGAALALQERGRSTAILDRHPHAAGETSYGNTGIIQSEAAYPYTFPRNPSEIVAAAFNRDPRAHIRHGSLLNIAPSLFRYWRAGASAPREKSGLALRALVSEATSEHRKLADAADAGALLREGGWIKAFRTRRGRDRGMREAEETRVFGVRHELLDRGQLLEREPHLGDAAIGGVHFTDPLTTSDPGSLAGAYLDLFVKRGGVVLKGDARTLNPSGSGWTVDSEAGPAQARDVVVALGPWSGRFASGMGVSLPFFVKRGYHMHYAPRGNGGLTRPVLDYEKGYVVTPMAQGLRLTTGAEFAGVDDPASSAHLDRVEPFARTLYPIAERLERAPWLGRRPCLPDMLPMIGASPRHRGLWFDFGHQHRGLTLGPVSGRLLADLVTGATPFIDPAPYAAGRFA